MIEEQSNNSNTNAKKLTHNYRCIRINDYSYYH